MKVRLGGFNIDSKTMMEFAGKRRDLMTPEIISASYARISRDPRDIGLLRDEARKDVERARKSNRTIVFGLGHSSIAEHAVFNFDVSGLSRLAVESVQHFRLASFTEKSQRYIRLGKDFVVPREVSESGLKGEFMSLMKYLADSYAVMYESMVKAGEKDETAKEDARYLMPLATAAQFGMTVNARELEYMISRLASHPLGELREFASRLSAEAVAIAPSLVKYPEPTAYFRDMHRVREGIADAAGKPGEAGGADGPAAVLLETTPDADRKLVAALLFSSSGLSHREAMRAAARMGARKREAVIYSTMREMKPHDGAWREFERIRFLFELTVSSSCFAQLKRHRMATIIPQDYLPSLGITVPGSVRRAGKVGMLREAARRAEKIASRIGAAAGGARNYALLNAHRRRVLFETSLRELYGFSRLRCDAHAQWEIRNLAETMCSLARAEVPAGAALLCGKDSFEGRKSALFDGKEA